jgi:hypothetical protein
MESLLESQSALLLMPKKIASCSTFYAVSADKSTIIAIGVGIPGY